MDNEPYEKQNEGWQDSKPKPGWMQLMAEQEEVIEIVSDDEDSKPAPAKPELVEISDDGDDAWGLSDDDEWEKEMAAAGSGTAIAAKNLAAGGLGGASGPAPDAEPDAKPDVKPALGKKKKKAGGGASGGGGAKKKARPGPLSLSPAEKTAHLATLPPGDRDLQRVLWHLGFNFKLFPHQPAAVRMVAGVPADWPRLGAGGSLGGALLRAPPGERGGLLGDVMGLGKTVEALGGAALRQGICRAKNLAPLPVVIVGPNASVLDQWYDHLVMGGVAKTEILKYAGKFKERTGKWRARVHPSGAGATWVLLTRHCLMNDVRAAMDSFDSGGDRASASPLFSTASPELLDDLRTQYLSANAILKGKNDVKEKGETEHDCVRRLVDEFYHNGGPAPTIRTLIIDEAHFLRNQVSFWGIGAALCGQSAERCVMATGTPFNNGPRDMAALQSYVDASNAAASTQWWVDAVSGKGGAEVAAAVRSWREGGGMLRRGTEVLAQQLPDKTVRAQNMVLGDEELFAYLPLEDSLLELLDKFAGTDDADKKEKLRLFQIMMAIMSLMRMSLIHSLAPHNGRELSHHFSPSRRGMNIGAWPKDKCVMCAPNLSQEAKDRDTARGSGKQANRFFGAAGPKSTLDLDDNDGDDDDGGEKNKKDDEDEDKGPLVDVPDEYCHLMGPNSGHRIRASCLAKVTAGGAAWSCPRCDDLAARAQVGQDGAKTYCAGVKGGFVASTKLLEALEDIRAKPAGEKTIVFSFFKAPLDLLEAMLDEEGVECLRFDGDLPQNKRGAVLDEFRDDDDKLVLLMTVHSGGTGLNITRANHVVFLDRWFNPQVHFQAQARCHRIGQDKEVDVSFFDATCTLDEVMAEINKLKEGNADVVLADGSAVGAPAAGALTFADLTGVLGKKLKEIAARRQGELGGGGGGAVDVDEDSDVEVADAKPKPLKRANRSPGGAAEKKPKVEPKRESVDLTASAASPEKKLAMIKKLEDMGYPTPKAKRGLRRTDWSSVADAVDLIEAAEPI
ncbi:ATP binding protein [Aureococcus anophagefferens]|nr:ATP binding protein [Aureococcus anophagefferens]